MSPADAAAAYERHINDNWDRLSPYEQDQARAYMQSKFEGTAPVQPQPQAYMASMPQQPGFPAASPMMYGSNPMYGYGPGAFGPQKSEPGGGWAIPVGYIGLLLFTPLAFCCGVYLLAKGRTGHGIAQVAISVTFFLITFMLLVSMP